MGSKKDISVTIFSKSLVFNGDVLVKGDLRIEGKVEGTVLCSGKVVIAAKAEVVGPIHAKWIDLIGSCNGDIYASEGINLSSEAILTGDLTTKSISIDKNARIQGQIQIDRNIPSLDIEEIRNSRRNSYDISNIPRKEKHSIMSGNELNKEYAFNKSDEVDSEPVEIFGGGWV